MNNSSPQVVNEVKKRRDHAVGQRDDAAQGPACAAVIQGASTTFTFKEQPRAR